MASSNLEIHLSSEDRAAIASEVFNLLKPFVHPTDERMFWSEEETAKWLGISRTTLTRLRSAGMVTPERNARPFGYGPESRQRLVELMHNKPEWKRAMRLARKVHETPTDSGAE